MDSDSKAWLVAVPGILLTIFIVYVLAAQLVVVTSSIP